MADSQATARTALHGCFDRGRGQGVIGTHTTMGTIGGGDGDGAHYADKEPRRWSDAKDPGGQDGAVAPIARDVGGDSKAKG